MPSCIIKHNNRNSDYITKNKKKEKLKDGLQNDNFLNAVKATFILISKDREGKIKKLNLYNFIFYGHTRAFYVGDR